MTLPSSIRRLLFWGHLSVGIVVGLWVVFMATTGALIAFQSDMVRLGEQKYRIAAPAADGCVTPSSLRESAQRQAGKSASALVLFADPHRPSEVLFGRKNAWLMDGCRGSVVAPHVGGIRAFLGQIMELHYALSFRDRPHPQLREFKNAANLGFLFLLSSGLFLWLPRKMTWQHVRPSLLLRRKAKGRARDWNWHNVAGIWLAVPLLSISLTGTVMAYPWASNLLYRIAGEQPPAPAEAPKTPRASADATATAVDRAVTSLQLREPHWERLELRLPDRNAKTITAIVEWGGGGNPQRRVLAQVSPATGEILKFERLHDVPRGRQWRFYARYLHTGELFGPVGKIAALAACIAALTLVWTGFALSWRRWTGWRRRRSLKQSPSKVLVS